MFEFMSRSVKFDLHKKIVPLQIWTFSVLLVLSICEPGAVAISDSENKLICLRNDCSSWICRLGYERLDCITDSKSHSNC